jgi:hypothetical protein
VAASTFDASVTTEIICWAEYTLAASDRSAPVLSAAGAADELLLSVGEADDSGAWLYEKPVALLELAGGDIEMNMMKTSLCWRGCCCSAPAGQTACLSGNGSTGAQL